MMNEKIVITVQQDIAIKSLSDGMRESIITRHIQGWVRLENVCLNKLTTAQMARILYEPNSYEVEQPKIEIGEWVKIIKHFKPMISNGSNKEAYKLERIFKVTELILGGRILCSDRYVHNSEDLIHATKEEIFWAELGREFNEFVDGDRIIFKDDTSYIIDSKYPSANKHVKGQHEKGRVSGFYPANSFIKLP